MAPPNLTRDEAQQRAALLDVASYDVELDLTDGGGKPGDATFRSTTTVRFASNEAGADTWIDLVAASVESATLNGDDRRRVRLPRGQGHRAGRRWPRRTS